MDERLSHNLKILLMIILIFIVIFIVYFKVSISIPEIEFKPPKFSEDKPPFIKSVANTRFGKIYTIVNPNKDKILSEISIDCFSIYNHKMKALQVQKMYILPEATVQYTLDSSLISKCPKGTSYYNISISLIK